MASAPTRLGCVLHSRARDVIKVSLEWKGARLYQVGLQEKAEPKYQLGPALGFCGRSDQLQLILSAYAHHSQGYRRCVVEYKNANMHQINAIPQNSQSRVCMGPSVVLGLTILVPWSRMAVPLFGFFPPLFLCLPILPLGSDLRGRSE